MCTNDDFNVLYKVNQSIWLGKCRMLVKSNVYKWSKHLVSGVIIIINEMRWWFDCCASQRIKDFHTLGIESKDNDNCKDWLTYTFEINIQK